MPHFTKEKINDLLPMSACIEVMQGLFRLSQSEIDNPPRMQMELSTKNRSLIMPAYIKPLKVFGVKVINLFPDNIQHGLSTHVGIMQLFETETGQLLASFNADELTAIRTAAVSAVATDILALKKAKHLCILGTGVQAGSHLAAMMEIRSIESVSIWGRTATKVAHFIKEQSKRYPNLTIQGHSIIEEATEGADIICTLTATSEPILKTVKKGCHINAVGSSTPQKRELTSDLVVSSRLFVDSLEANMEEAGDILIPLSEGVIGEEHILGDLNNLMRKEIIGRTKDEDITIFSSVGLAIEDVASAYYIFKKSTKKK